MPDKPSVTLVKEFSYRTQAEEWSNTYHFDGPTPDNAADWRALALDIWAQERTFLSTNVTIVAAYGYEAGNENSVAQIDLRLDPPAQDTGSQLDGHPMPGDTAVWIRYSTGLRNSRSRPIYGRNWYHGVPGADGDSIPSTIRTAMHTAAVALTDGSLLEDRKICGPQGAEYTTPLVAAFNGPRQLRRRGRRP